MAGRNERGTVPRFTVGMASILAVLVGGCEGDLSLNLMQRDLDSVRTEVAAVSRTNEGGRAFVEERLGKLEADLKSRLEKAAQERGEDVEGFLRSQASLTTKLDELTEEARLTQGRVEEIGHRISELSKRVDAVGSQVGQAVVTAQEARIAAQAASAAVQQATALAQQAAKASQQTAQDVTDALRQMAEQTNAALQQVNTTTQLALTEARKAVAAKQTVQPTDRKSVV